MYESEALTKKVKKILVPNLLMFGGLLVLLIVGTLIAIPGIQDVLESVGSTDREAISRGDDVSDLLM